jgi:predicted esterase
MKPTAILTAVLLCFLSPLSFAKPIKVFILAGQSNMEGQGSVDHDDERDSNGGKGNLVWSMKHSKSADKMKKLKNALFIKTTDFARPAELSPCPTHGHHWCANAESYFLIGEAAGEGVKRLSAITNAAVQDKNLPISATYGTTPKPPPMTNDAPAAGKRVRVTTPGSGYEGNPKVYHTLYLPPEWVPGQKYPVIIEYGGNGWTVEANKLGYYQSAGTGYIWVSMPNIDQNSTLGDKSDDFNTTSWWGSEGQNEVGAADDAAYAMATVIDLIENYGGDHSSVFVTGFSRGAVACGNLGLLNDAMADIWVGFLPHSHHDAWFDNGTRTDRVKGRASFITYGQNDGGGGNSRKGVDWLNARGFPVESYELAGTGHTDEWITDASAPLASSLSYTGHPLVSDVRARMRTWMSEVITNKPGTSRISGVVTDASGAPIAGVRVQSGLTHWTFTDATGAYKLAGLIDGARTVAVSHPSHRWSPDTLNVTLAGADLTGRNFQATTALP